MKKTARAHANIALIKYWGKADPILRLPLMSSLSMTLDVFFTQTTFETNTALTHNYFILNGKPQAAQQAQRVFNYIEQLQKRFQVQGHFGITSVNHVPTSAGLASSSSAFAALAASFVGAYELNCSKTELSRLARLGSGSATRSIFGGFVEWQAGMDDDSSIAIAIDEKPKLDLCLLAVEIDTKEKKISSTLGMDHAQTSPFFKPWLTRNQIEMAQMWQAIQTQNFERVGQLAELNANEMHAINLTANPGFTYFEPETLKAIKLVHQLRQEGISCYYTIDAGPNVKVLCQLRNRKIIAKRLQEVLENVKIVFAQYGPGVSYLD